MFSQFDSDGNQELSEEEIKGAGAVLVQADRNQDGFVTEEEWLREWGKRDNVLPEDGLALQNHGADINHIRHRSPRRPGRPKRPPHAEAPKDSQHHGAPF